MLNNNCSFRRYVLIRMVYLSLLMGFVFNGVSVCDRASSNVIVAFISCGASIGLPYLFVIAITGGVLSTPSPPPPPPSRVGGPPMKIIRYRNKCTPIMNAVPKAAKADNQTRRATRAPRVVRAYLEERDEEPALLFPRADLLVVAVVVEVVGWSAAGELLLVFNVLLCRWCNRSPLLLLLSCTADGA